MPDRRSLHTTALSDALAVGAWRNARPRNPHQPQVRLLELAAGGGRVV